MKDSSKFNSLKLNRVVDKVACFIFLAQTVSAFMKGKRYDKKRKNVNQKCVLQGRQNKYFSKRSNLQKFQPR